MVVNKYGQSYFTNKHLVIVLHSFIICFSKLLNELKVLFLESDKENSIYKKRQSLEQKHQEVIRKLKSSAALHGNENLSAISSTKSLAFLLSKQKTSEGSGPLVFVTHFKTENKAVAVDPAILKRFYYFRF